MARRTITKPSFQLLSEPEQAAIHAAVRALNVAATAKQDATRPAPQEIENAAFLRESQTLREPDSQSDYMRGWLESLERSNPTVPPSVIQGRRDAMYLQAIDHMSAALEQLIRTKALKMRPRKGSPPGWTGNSGVIIGAYHADAVPQHGSVSIDARGRAQITLRMRFRSALGLIAWGILTLSGIIASERAVIRCIECGAFKIVGVRKPQRFCSAKCRNKFTVREWRRKRDQSRRTKARRPK